MQPLQVIVHMPLPTSQVWPAGQVGTPGSQRSAASLQVSAPLHATPSLQLRAEPPLQVAPAVHVSPLVQYAPSSHEAPVRAVHALVELAGWQTWHWFVGLIAPEAWHAPEITQPLQVIAHMPLPTSQVWPAGQVGVPVSQRSADSLHVSVPLQATPSAHERGVPPVHAAAAVQVSPTVQ